MESHPGLVGGNSDGHHKYRETPSATARLHTIAIAIFRWAGVRRYLGHPDSTQEQVRQTNGQELCGGGNSVDIGAQRTGRQRNSVAPVGLVLGCFSRSYNRAAPVGIEL